MKHTLIILSILMTTNYLISQNYPSPISLLSLNQFDTIPKALDTTRYKIKGKYVTNNQLDSLINTAIKETIKKVKKKDLIQC